MITSVDFKGRSQKIVRVLYKKYTIHGQVTIYKRLYKTTDNLYHQIILNFMLRKNFRLKCRHTDWRVQKTRFLKSVTTTSLMNQSINQNAKTEFYGVAL